MKWTRNLAAVTLSTLLVTAQSDQTSNDTADLLPDFPAPCVSACDPFNASVRECGQLAESSESAAISCLCDGPFQSQLGACGTCILQNTPDVTHSESYFVIVQLSATFAKQCGKPVHLDGASPEISSALERFGAEGASTSAAGVDAAVTTSSTDQVATPRTSAMTTSSPSVRAAATSGVPSSAAPSGVSSGSAAAVETSGAGGQARAWCSSAALALPLLVAAML
ncbi:hypothetical protein BMF94_6850 [Rhodotorula taiwanensis]|uniref:Extracellular membrane protein CFEM domain-containing protein n=1 Tax=Rhodotorula taiwanensis TaxID=741276 RepID=A0A2S5B0F0_9BASI|nr:hypothetical protein BMF94_6850 [Rhodotorula taiwanensis]